MAKRIIAGLIAATAFVALLYFSDIPFLFRGVITAASVLAVYELLTALKSPKSLKILSIVYIVLSAISQVLIFGTPIGNWTSNRLIQLDIIIFDIVFIFSALFFNTFLPFLFILAALTFFLFRKKITFSGAAKTVLGTFIISYAFTTLINLIEIGSAETPFSSEAGVYLLILACIAAWFTDIGGYFAGRFLGGKIFKNRKLAPNLSPKKTIEGAIGGVIVCILTFLLAEIIYTTIFLNEYSWQSERGVSWQLILIVAPILSVCSIGGDLIASKIKRETGVKDFGSIMPGHGGLLDRCDSLLIVAPLLYAMLFLTDTTLFIARWF